ncbi:aldo/keto reductase [Microvirga rosea]|uniref:aldo/keto reductase n=1 Tax=Microvirga rosea TaxID=2715425 RepID=UPI001D0B4322|nr:aldo/keto reductase [Microvirga rosea]MCB8820619.1 aldo/keto reductase [Microvirga rosea]
MATTPLSAPGLKLGLGLVSLGRIWGVGQSAPPTEDEAQELLSRAVDLGIAIFDTAPAYAASEARLGRFLAQLPRSSRDGLAIMTKAGEHWDHDAGTSFVDHGRDALIRSIDRSLALLGSIDVLQIHKATKDVVAHPDVIAAMDYAKSCGVTVFGASVSDVESGLLAIESGFYQSLQFPFNMQNTGMSPLLAALQARRCTAVVNRPFAMGGLILGQSFEEAARTAFRFIEDALPDAIVLSGTGRTAHLEQNVAAFRHRTS